MKSIFILFSVILLSSVSTTHAQEKTCKDVTIKNCPGLFADSCRNEIEFQKKNGYACLKILNNSVQNQAFCAGVDMAPCQSENPDCRSIQNDEERLKCCSSIPNMKERLKCEDGFPDCTSGTPELKKRFNDLAKAVKAELESYGGVLDIDLDNVGDREALCGLTFESMEEYYKQATMTDTPIDRFLDESREIADCKTKIEGWVDNQNMKIFNSEFQKKLIESTRDDLKNLQPLRVELNRSVSELKEAGPKLYQLMKFHLRFCPNN